MVIKKGDVIEAQVNGRKVYSGPAPVELVYSFSLIVPKSNPKYGCYADYKEVIFKKLN